MYPKVKVRAVDDDDHYEVFSKNPLRGFNSLSIRDSTPPVIGVRHSSSVSVAKIPKSYVPRSITPPPSLPKPAKNSESEEDGKKPRIRASSIPRPRAVISSRDNDQILGSKNKLRLRPSSVTNHNLAKSRQSEGKCTEISTTTTTKKLFKSGEGKVTNARTCIETSTTAKKLSNNGGCKITSASDAKAKKVPGIDVRVPITNISKGKPCFRIT